MREFNAKIFSRAVKMVAEIMKLNYDGRDDIDEDMATQLISIFNGDYEAWRMIDEETGRFDAKFYRNKFWMVRRLRNHPTFGRRLFDSFKKS